MDLNIYSVKCQFVYADQVSWKYVNEIASHSEIRVCFTMVHKIASLPGGQKLPTVKHFGQTKYHYLVKQNKIMSNTCVS